MGSRQTDEEAGHNKTRKYLAEEWARMSKNWQRKAIIIGAEEKPKLDAAREHSGILFIPTDESDHEDITNNARRKLEIRTVSVMPCKVIKPGNPNGSSWGAILRK